jgi:hypothetical protein
MPRNLFLFWLLALSLLSGPLASAQIDPASGLLLNQSGNDSALGDDSGLGSGRYTVRPKATPKPHKKNHIDARAPHSVAPATPEPTLTPMPVLAATPPVSPTPAAALATTPVATPVQAATSSPTPVTTPKPLPTPVTAVAAPVPTPAPTPVPAQTVRPPATTDREPTVDRRTNILDINFAPIYFVRASKSTYDFRNYQLNSSGLSLDANTWLRPDVGIHTSFLSTMGGNLQDSLTGTKNIAATEQWFQIGARYRRFSRLSALSPTLTFGIDWADNELKIPNGAVLRQQLHTSGVNLSLSLDYPISESYSWTGALNLIPSASQTEGTGSLAYSSGLHSSTDILGVSLGGRFTVDREDAIYWKVNGYFEKDNYSGPAEPLNPTTGQSLSNVSITTSTLIFELGYSWGD